MENCIVVRSFESAACPLPVLRDFEYCGHRQICSQDIFCHIFLGNHTTQLPDIWHRALVRRTVSCNTVLNLRHVHFLFDATLNISKKRSRQATHVFPGRLTIEFLMTWAISPHQSWLFRPFMILFMLIVFLHSKQIPTSLTWVLNRK